ncbi:ubiquinone-dependent pyruvate dehydrogenase [Serinibacter salmoneus]|uniref:Pyruvate dehydrogenase (Quinone) n=1 Tax=Serinibacter salmoneus TaxID=556530 RepID=A0A2A9D0J3_9MICO|nr:ubiquinone-dependent pyruvate dehydrogenase [Serinibacter salmoneus]PFG20207.1 pyruvate dehydrogenase (quinone) [Serinibacter salmoneus]
MTTIAETIVRTLEASGVSRMYGIPGDSLNGLTDALRSSDIAWIPVRHEETAGFAASAEAQLTDELAVAVGSCGPGNLHLINGLYDANRSRVPVLAIAAHIPSEEIGSGYFQETHPTDLFRECSVYVEQVSNAKQMPRMLRTAMQAALSKRGVAVLVIPGDVAMLTAQDETATNVRAPRSQTVPVEEDLVALAEQLTGKVTILAGAGCAGAHDEVVALADALAAPIVHTLRSKDILEWDNPFDVGMTGLLGFESGYRAMESCDTLLMLGTDFPYRPFLPEDAHVIQVDIRGENIGRRIPVDLPVVGGVKETVTALLPRLTPVSDRGHLERSLKHYRKTRESLDDLATPRRGDAALHPQYVARMIDEVAADDAVFIPDVGSPVVWAARYLTMNSRRRLIGSFIHGSMANAITQSVGAQSSQHGRQIVALAGDGGLTMMMGELLTLAELGLPVKLVVFNNSSYNFVELEMKAAGFVPTATGLESANLAGIASASGLYAQRVAKSKDLPKALKAAFAHDGPALVDVVTERQELVLPPSITFEQTKGFGLYALRTLLSGRGDEIVELARANARQLL